MRNSFLSLLFLICSFIHISGVLCSVQTSSTKSKTFLLCLGFFFLIGSIVMYNIKDSKVERDDILSFSLIGETFISAATKKRAAEKAEKKRVAEEKKKAEKVIADAKRKKEQEAEDKTKALVLKSKSALSIAESPSSSNRDIEKAIADSKDAANECSTILADTKTTKTKADAQTTKKNVEKAEAALVAKIESVKKMGIPNIRYVEYRRTGVSKIGPNLVISQIMVFDEKGNNVAAQKKCTPKNGFSGNRWPCTIAIDGLQEDKDTPNTLRNWNEGMWTNYVSGDEHFIRVDLEGDYMISKIKIFNSSRQNGTEDRNIGIIKLYTKDDPDTPVKLNDGTTALVVVGSKPTETFLLGKK